jgi:hypothetical protein
MDVTAALFTVAVTAASMAPAAPASTVPAPIATSVASASELVIAGAAEDLGQRPSLRQLSLMPGDSRRPSALVPLYASMAIMQGFDIYSTSSALSRGGVEVNPGMKPVAGKTWASAAVKAAATAGSIYFLERAWKQNRKGAVIVATIINVATAAVVAHNTSVAKQR